MKTTRRIWLPAAVVLLLGAIVVESFAKREAALGIRSHARAAQALHDGRPVDRARAAATARKHADTSTTAATLGLATAVLGAGAWFFSLQRGEAGRLWIPPVLLTLYILWVLMLV